MKSFKGYIEEKGKGEANESTKAYGDTLRKIANDRKLKSLSKKDKDTLAKIADMLSKANEEVSLDEAPYVAGDMNIVDSLWNEIRDKMFKDKMGKGTPRENDKPYEEWRRSNHEDFAIMMKEFCSYSF